MNMHSLLYVPSDPLSMMVKHLGLTGCPVEWLSWCIGNGTLRCPLSLSPKVLLDSLIYSSGHLMCGHLNLYITPLFKFAVPVLGNNEEGFYGAGPFEMYLNPQAVVCPFETFPQVC